MYGWFARLRRRRWPRVVVAFAIGMVSLDMLVHAHRATWRRYDPDDYRERVRACRDGAWDLVVVGGSPVHEGVDPSRLFGVNWRGTALKKIFNCGLEGATSSDVWLSVRHGVTSPPRLLVYGITATDVNDGRGEPHGPRMLMDAKDLVTSWRLRPSVWTTRDWLIGQASRSWNLYHYRHGIRLWLADQFPGFAPAADKEVADNLRISNGIATNSGYVPRPKLRERSLAQLKPRGLPFAHMNNYRLGGHLAHLNRMLDWAQEQKVPVVLVDMPVSAELEERRFAAAFLQYRKALRNLEAERGVQVIWARRNNVGLTDGDFADLIHLNGRGSRKFTSWLRDNLENQKSEGRGQGSEVSQLTPDS